MRKTSGSLKLEKRSENKQAKPNLYRHSSLGILPSTIAIGSGLYLDDPYDDLMKMRRESGAVKSNKVHHNGPGIIGLRQPQSSTTPNTSHRSEFSTLTQNRNGNVYTPTRGTNNYKTHSDAMPLRPCVPIESFHYNCIIIIIFFIFNHENNCYNCFVNIERIND